MFPEGGEPMRQWRNRLRFAASTLLLFTIVLAPVISAYGSENDRMEKRCRAVKEGTEADMQTKVTCASYFEEAGVNPVTGVAVKTAPASGVTFNKAALVLLGVGAGVALLGATVCAP